MDKAPHQDKRRQSNREAAINDRALGEWRPGKHEHGSTERTCCECSIGDPTEVVRRAIVHTLKRVGRQKHRTIRSELCPDVTRVLDLLPLEI